jgi:hypothetical protein
MNPAESWLLFAASVGALGLVLVLLGLAARDAYRRRRP